jgi:hypothetical protein
MTLFYFVKLLVTKGEAGRNTKRSRASNCSFFLSTIKGSFLLHEISTLQIKIKCLDYKIRKDVLFKYLNICSGNKFYTSLHVLCVSKKKQNFNHPRNTNHDYIRNTNLGHEKEIFSRTSGINIF